MCFSAPASFVAGAALTATGVATRRATKKRKKERLFASIPLLFGIQQLIDGVAWLVIGGSALLTTVAAYGYLFFAYLLWPAFVPVAVWKLEPNPKRKKLLLWFIGIGALTALYALYLMVAGPASAEIVNSCVRYTTTLPYWWPMLIPYLLATCGSFLVSSVRFVQWFGLVILISSAIAGWFYTVVFASVWCFFAAILSGMIYWQFHKA